MKDEPPDDQAADIGREQADPDRLMDGEDPTTRHPEDARHWLGVYQELYAFKSDVLEKLRLRRAEMTTGEAQEEARADERLLVLELARFQERAEFWAQRLRELEGS